jgi:SAM-dependent methyltransferase
LITKPDSFYYDLLLFPHHALENSDEFTLGMRDLMRRLPSLRRSYTISSPETAPVPSDFVDWSDAPFLMVLLNPALLISDNLEQQLFETVATNGIDCAVPADPRDCGSGMQIDYASRQGFDRFVKRLSGLPCMGSYDGRVPWVYLLTRQTLAGLANQAVLWAELPVFLGERTAVARHCFVHSYADYYLSSRAEMLPFVPDTVRTLLDVGGGAGNFGKLFMDERGGYATLLELNPKMAAVARQKGLQVLVGDLQHLVLTERYDCVTMLDLLEHLADPLSALLRARQALKPGGYLLLAVPNAGHWSVVWDLLQGDFDYIPIGILCTTHLRFFTRKSLARLLDDAGFIIEKWENSVSPIPEQFATFLADHKSAGVCPDPESLAIDSFRILASAR